MSMLVFDPWAALKDAREARKGANPANLANPTPQQPPRLAELAGLAGLPDENENARLSGDRSLSRLKTKLSMVTDVEELSGFLHRQVFDPTLPDWTERELATINARARCLIKNAQRKAAQDAGDAPPL